MIPPSREGYIPAHFIRKEEHVDDFSQLNTSQQSAQFHFWVVLRRR